MARLGCFFRRRELTVTSELDAAVARLKARAEAQNRPAFRQHMLDLRLVLAELERRGETLAAISAIRDSIVGAQKFNWSEHAYPLVAALDAAGYVGAGYKITHANLNTLVNQAKSLEAERDAARAEVESLRANLAMTQAEIATLQKAGALLIAAHQEAKS